MFVSLVIFDEFFVFLKSKVLTINIFEKKEIHGPIVEFLFSEHSIFDKNFQIIPLFLKILAAVFKNLSQSISYLFIDVTADFFHIRIALQIRT